MAKHVRSSDHHLWAVRDGRRAVLAVMLLIFVGAASLSDGRLIPSFLSGRPTAAVAPAIESDDDNLRTGSILITPANGNICEHRLIDNETWRIRPNGTVQCDEAIRFQAHRGGEFTTFTRIDAIRDGFVSRR